MKREKVEQNLLDAKQKVKDINAKYQEKKKALEDSYALEVKSWKEKEKFWNSKLNEMDNKEKLDLNLDNALELELMNSLKSKNARISAEQVFHHLAMKEINPVRKAQLQSRVVEAIQYMQQEQKNALQLNRVLGLQRV